MFKAGQMVVCIVDASWIDLETKELCEGPKYQEYLIIDFMESGNGFLALEFNKYHDKGGYRAKWFRTIDTIKESIEFAESITKELEIEHAEPAEVCT